MEIIRHLAGALYGNVLWQPLVQRIADFFRRDPGPCIKNCHISQRMDIVQERYKSDGWWIYNEDYEEIVKKQLIYKDYYE